MPWQDNRGNVPVWLGYLINASPIILIIISALTYRFGMSNGTTLMEIEAVRRHKADFVKDFDGNTYFKWRD